MSVKTGAVLFMSAEDASLGKHGNYGDDSGSRYAWDTTVPNHSVPMVGDVVLIRSKHRVIGVSVITQITAEPSFKLRARCSKCSSTKLKWSKPREAFRCACGQYTDTPVTEFIGGLTAFEADYDLFFTPLNAWDVEKARSISLTPKSIHSIQKVAVKSLLEGLPPAVASKLGFEKISGSYVRVEKRAVARTDTTAVPTSTMCEITGIYAPGHISEMHFAIYNFRTASFDTLGFCSVLDVVGLALSNGEANLTASGKSLAVPINTPNGPVTYEYPLKPSSSQVGLWLTAFAETR